MVVQRPDPGSPVACAAPSLVLDLDPAGYVNVCCANSMYPLGHVSTDRLLDLWHGQRANAIRQAVRAGDLGYGCGVCRHRLAFDAGEVPRDYYDTLGYRGDDQPWPTLMVFSLHNTCNLACVMCGGDSSSRIRTQRDRLPGLPHRYGDAFFEQLPPFLEQVAAVEFRGGEPFLIREHQRVVDLLVGLGRRIPNSVTTNGMVWDERVTRMLDALPTSVILSFDGATAKTFEAVRAGSSFATVVEHLWRFRAYTQEQGTYFALSMSLVRHNWHELGAVLRFGEEHGIPVHVQTVLEADHGVQRLPDAELAEVVAHLDAEEPGLLRDLDRNRAVWEREVGRLRSELAARSRPGPRLRIGEQPHPDNARHVEAVVRRASPRAPAASLGRRIASSVRRRSLVDEAAAVVDVAAVHELERWTQTTPSPTMPLAWLDLDDTGRAVAANLDGLLPVELGDPAADEVVGRSLAQVLDLLAERTESSLWVMDEFLEPGRSQHTLFLGPATREKRGLVIRMIGVVRGPAGTRLHLASDRTLWRRSDQVTAVQVGRRAAGASLDGLSAPRP